MSRGVKESRSRGSKSRKIARANFPVSRCRIRSPVRRKAHITLRSRLTTKLRLQLTINEYSATDQSERNHWLKLATVN